MVELTLFYLTKVLAFCVKMSVNESESARLQLTERIYASESTFIETKKLAFKI
jgi:hypothetical protein